MSEIYSKLSDKKCFTFTWKLENASYCIQKKSEKIVSPVFVVDEIHATKWRLCLYPRGKTDGNYIGFYLYRVKDYKDVIDRELRYELAFIAEDGSKLTSNHGITRSFITRSFLPGGGGFYGFPQFELREKVFISKRSTFLPGNILTACCRIWKSVGELTENVYCLARTRVGIEKRSFMWNLKNFSAIELGELYSYEIKSLDGNTKLASVDLSVDGGLNCDEIIRFKVSCYNQIFKFCVLHIYLVDSVGNHVECNHDEFWFDRVLDSQHFTFFQPALVYSQHFTFSLPMQKLKEKSNSYLPNGVLSLYWEFVFSKGIVFEEIEEVKFGNRVPKTNLVESLKRLAVICCFSFMLFHLILNIFY